MSVKNKQNSSDDFLVRDKFFIQAWRRRQRGRNNAKHYKYPDSIGDA